MKMNMWFLFALAFALITSITTIVAKKIMQDTGEYLYILLTTVFTLPFLFLIVIYFYEIPQFDKTFLLVLAASTSLDVLAAIFAYRAIKITEVSLIAPMAAFNPVFTTGVSFIALGEKIGVRGIIGILTVCVGAYVLQISKRQKGWLSPIRTLLVNKGVQLSLIAYFIWAITPIFQKTAILHTTPQVPPFASLVGTVGLGIAFVPIVAKLSKRPVFFAKRYLKLFILLGVLGATATASAFIAFSQAQLGFVTSIFKLSIVFTVIFGWLFLKEKNIRDKILGSTIMLAGVILLAT